MGNISKKSEILFLYETSYNIPNGDPFTGEQRYDEETKNILVSDVRMKRFVRDYLEPKEQEDMYIYIKQKGEDSQKSAGGQDGSGSARRIGELTEQLKKIDENKPENERRAFSKAIDVMKACIDVRLFGGISTKEKDAVNLTGPVQFALLNPSLNRVDLKIHQNTSVLESKQSNKQGAIATTTLVPYSLIQIHGWVNPKVAEKTGMSEDDLRLMFEGLWYGTSGDGSSHSRSKVGQNSVLLLEIVYKANNQKIYGVDRLIQLTPAAEKRSESLRSLGIEDSETTTESTGSPSLNQVGILDFSKLIKIAEGDKVEEIRFYTEIEKIKEILKGKKNFKEIKSITVGIRD
jgi:CRISPR-associated protein Csh2